MAHSRKKILFIAEGITMTHFVRPAALAQSLDRAEWDVSFWTPKRYHPMLEGNFSHLGDLKTLDPGVFLEKLTHGKVLYQAPTLRQYVKDDRDILKQVQPDLVIGDYRLSLSISASLSGIPYAPIFNAYWSPYQSLPAIVPELPLTRWISPTLLNPLFALVQKPIFARYVKPVNDVRKEFGLPAISNVYTAGDLVLYPDIEAFVPLTGAPSNHRYVGICSWIFPTQKPAWWSEVMSSSRPKIFVSMGSSGSLEVMPAILEAASRLSIDVILASSGRRMPPLGPHMYAADYLPYQETASLSDVVISNGGSGGVYSALAAGKPILAIPGNIDSHLSAERLNQVGAGLVVRSEQANFVRLYRALQRLLSESHFLTSAERLAGEISRFDTKTVFPQVLREWFTR